MICLNKTLLVFVFFIICSVSVSAQLADSAWPTFHGNLQRTGQSSVDTSHVDGTLKWAFQTEDGIESSPSIASDGTIYIADHAGYLYAVNPDGTEKWRLQLDEPEFNETYSVNLSTRSSPAIASDGTIYLTFLDQHLHAINPDGTEKWKFPLNLTFDNWMSPAIGSDGTIYINSSNPNAGVRAINPNGTEKWHYPAPANMFNSPAVGKDGTIYAGIPSSYSDNHLVALNPNGSVKWTAPTHQFLESSPAIASDGTIYIGSFLQDIPGAGLYAFSPDGTQKWFFETTSHEICSTPSIASDGTIYFGDLEGFFYALNPAGEELWHFEVDGTAETSAAIGAEGTIYFGSSLGDDEPSFFALNPDGSVNWSYPAGSVASSPAIAEDGTIYIGSWNGYLYAFGGPNGTTVNYASDIEASVEDTDDMIETDSEPAVEYHTPVPETERPWAETETPPNETDSGHVAEDSEEPVMDSDSVLSEPEQSNEESSSPPTLGVSFVEWIFSLIQNFFNLFG